MYKLVLAVVAGFLGFVEPAGAFEDNPETAEERSLHMLDKEAPFQPSIDAMTDVDILLQRALKNNKMAMVIMGANWCHDSRGLIEHLQDAEVSKVLEAAYDMITVDVGYLDHGLGVAPRFGLPVIYGTPTVLIIDPVSGKLLNKDTVNRWRESAAMTKDEIIALLRHQPRTAMEPIEASDELTRLFEGIAAFEQQQAARIYGGFAIIGPMLAAEERPSHFNRYWNQLRDLRYNITSDLKALREEAKARTDASETGITLRFPSYPAFDWENADNHGS